MAYSSSYSPFYTDKELENKYKSNDKLTKEEMESPRTSKILFNGKIYFERESEWINCYSDGSPFLFVYSTDGTFLFSHWGTSDDGLIKKTKPEHLQPIFERFRIDGKKIIIENNQTVLKPALR
jgi:hypothetical protein